MRHSFPQLSLLSLAGLLILAGGCSRTADRTGGEGTLSVGIEPDSAIEEKTKGDVGDYASLPKAEDFTLTILNYASVVAWEGKFSDFDPSMKFPAGDYTASVQYGSTEKEGAGQACFSASEAFCIVELENTPVTLKPALSNCIVKLSVGKYLRKYFSRWSFKLTSGAGNSFDMSADNASVFIDAYKFTLEGSFETALGKTASFSRTFDSLAAAHCYTVNVELDNVEDVSFTITFNDNVETITIEEELN